MKKKNENRKCIIDFNLKIMFVVGAFYSGSSSSRPVDIFPTRKIIYWITNRWRSYDAFCGQGKNDDDYGVNTHTHRYSPMIFGNNGSLKAQTQKSWWSRNDEIKLNGGVWRCVSHGANAFINSIFRFFPQPCIINNTKIRLSSIFFFLLFFFINCQLQLNK